MARARPAQPVEMPKLPPDVFTNFSPFPQPPAVNVLLLDSLNTRMEDQSVVHSAGHEVPEERQAGNANGHLYDGISTALYSGFNDDPAVLAATLNNKKNIEVETSVMLESQAETNAESKFPLWQSFFAEHDKHRSPSIASFARLPTCKNWRLFSRDFRGGRTSSGLPRRRQASWLTGGGNWQSGSR